MGECVCAGVYCVCANMAAQEVVLAQLGGGREQRLEAQNVEIVLCCVMITTMRTFAQFLI